MNTFIKLALLFSLSPMAAGHGVQMDNEFTATHLNDFVSVQPTWRSSARALASPVQPEISGRLQAIEIALVDPVGEGQTLILEFRLHASAESLPGLLLARKTELVHIPAYDFGVGQIPEPLRIHFAEDIAVEKGEAYWAVVKVIPEGDRVSIALRTKAAGALGGFAMQPIDSRGWTRPDHGSAGMVGMMIADTAGVPFCDPMLPNVTGLSTKLVGNFGTGVGSGLNLMCVDGPPGEFGYFLMGSGFQDPGQFTGNGRLCLSLAAGDSIGHLRFGSTHNSMGQFDSLGVLQNLAGTSLSGAGFDVPQTTPIAGVPFIEVGSTWHFQLLHRDGSGLWNLSNGLSVTFP